MKSIFLSVSALALTACAATAADEPRAEFRQREVHVVRSGDHAMSRHDARVIEVISEDGDRTVHVTSGDGSSVITVDGQRIEVIDGAVIVDGERHDFDGGRVVIERGEVRVSEGPGPHRTFTWRTGPERAEMNAEIAVAMAAAERALAEVESIDWGTHEAELAEALAELDGMEIEIVEPEADTWITRDGERMRFGDMSPEEQAEIREEIAEARIHARRGIEQARIEMRNAQGEQRHARIEMRRARDEARQAGRDARHAMRWDFGDMSDASSIRVESEDGTTRVWLDDRELEGEELGEFLDRMEERNARFAEMAFGDDPNVMVFRSEDGETNVIRRGRVVIDINSDDDGERQHVIEIRRSSEDELEGNDD